jgi:hypothetical protein
MPLRENASSSRLLGTSSDGAERGLANRSLRSDDDLVAWLKVDVKSPGVALRDVAELYFLLADRPCDATSFAVAFAKVERECRSLLERELRLRAALSGASAARPESTLTVPDATRTHRPNTQAAS